MANLPLAFAELLGGGVLLTAGVSGASIPEVFAGSVSLKPFDTAAAATSAPASAGAGSTAQVREWIAQGLQLAGVPATKQNIDILEPRVMQESGGDPRAINLWDSNAKKGTPSKGFLQTIDATFQAHKVPGHDDIWNPVDNTAASVRYMMATYGHLVGAGGGGY